MTSFDFKNRHPAEQNQIKIVAEYKTQKKVGSTSFAFTAGSKTQLYSSNILKLYTAEIKYLTQILPSHQHLLWSFTKMFEKYVSWKDQP